VSSRIKVDEDLPHQIADLLIERGHDALTVVGQGWQGFSDEDLWPRIQNEQRWLITADKGFADLRQHPPGSHAGVILLRPRKKVPVPIWNLRWRHLPALNSMISLERL
jgi:predicted nuclease of predicted toxin-antitoxin system